MKKIKLLLVDDHQMIMDGVQAFLEKEPHLEIAGMATTGEAALTALENLAVDLVILDVMMPGMDGIEVAKMIRKRYPRTKIILLTMISGWRFISSAFNVGINGYVLKDKSKESLIGGIHAVMNGHRYYPPDLPDPDPDDVGEEEKEAVILTSREKEILRLMAKNPELGSRELAARLFIAKATVEKHVQNVKQKLNVHRNTELIKYVLNNKLT